MHRASQSECYSMQTPRELARLKSGDEDHRNWFPVACREAALQVIRSVHGVQLLENACFRLSLNEAARGNVLR